MLRRAKRAEDALEHARAEAEKASQRAASAEVKLQVLQKAVQQAEERAATLEMQVCSNDCLNADHCRSCPLNQSSP